MAIHNYYLLTDNSLNLGRILGPSETFTVRVNNTSPGPSPEFLPDGSGRGRSSGPQPSVFNGHSARDLKGTVFHPDFKNFV